MFSHVMLGADDVDAARRFYDATLGALGIAPGVPDGKGRVIWRGSHGLLLVGRPLNGEPACHANGGTIGFGAASADQVQAWHDAGVSAGGTSVEDPPGWRQGGFGPLFLAYLRDPAGNKLCALYRDAG